MNDFIDVVWALRVHIGLVVLAFTIWYFAEDWLDARS